MTDQTFPQQQYFSAEDCRTLYPPGTPYGNDHPNGWQDMADRLNALLASRLPAPTVVVPEPTSDEWRMIAENARSADMVDFLAGAAAYGLWLRKNARAIPADRVLGEGMVAVPREEWERLQKFHRDTKEADSRDCSDCAHYRNSQSCPGCMHPYSPQNEYAFDWLLAQRCEFYALRANQGGADHA